LFHKFIPNDSSEARVIHVEIVWREYVKEQSDGIEAVAVSGASKESQATSGLHLLLSSRESKNKTNMLPIVNEREGISQFYTLFIPKLF